MENSEQPFDFSSVPLDVWKLIIAQQPFSWLIVSKYFGSYAKHVKATDPRFKPDSKENKAFRAAVLKKNIEEVKYWLNSGQVDPAAFRNWALRFGAADGCVEMVALLLKEPTVNPTACRHEALIYACRNGHGAVVELLLNDRRVDPSYNNNQPFNEALNCSSGQSIRALINHPRYKRVENIPFASARAGVLGSNADVVKIIIDMDNAIPGLGSELLGDVTSVESVQVLIEAGADPTALRQRLFRNAVVYDRYDIARYLLTVPQVDPAAQTNWNICFAAEAGNERMVRLLLSDPRVDPTARDNYALRYACQSGHLGVVEILLDDKRVSPAAGERKPLTHAVLPSKVFSRYAQNREEPKFVKKLEIVNLLLLYPEVDPAYGDNQALKAALEAESSPGLIERLLELPSVNPQQLKYEDVVKEFQASRARSSSEPISTK